MLVVSHTRSNPDVLVVCDERSNWVLVVIGVRSNGELALCFARSNTGQGIDGVGQGLTKVCRAVRPSDQAREGVQR